MLTDPRKIEEQAFQVDGYPFEVSILRQRIESIDAPRLAMVCYLNSNWAFHLTRVAIQSLQAFTQQPNEIWVVDNGSPKRYLRQLKKIKGINLVVNHTDPIGLATTQNGVEANSQLRIGSIANAVGLELVARAIDQGTKYLFVMHNDVLAVRLGWLNFLLSKITHRVRGAAVVSDPTRVQAMHVSGMLLDFQLYRNLDMSFMPNLPEYDVGDDVTLKLRENGFDYFVCRNTFLQPELEGLIPRNSPLLNLYADRAFDDNDNVVFMHMGRGTYKSAGLYKTPGKTYPRQWVKLAEHYLSGAKKP